MGNEITFFFLIIKCSISIYLSIKLTRINNICVGYEVTKGIEVAHTFLLGQKYSKVKFFLEIQNGLLTLLTF